MIVASSTGRDVNQPSELGDQGSGFVAAGIAIGAVYFYFLIFAEFALLELARPLIDEKLIQLRSLMACLGVGGVVGRALAESAQLGFSSMCFRCGGGAWTRLRDDHAVGRRDLCRCAGLVHRHIGGRTEGGGRFPSHGSGRWSRDRDGLRFVQPSLDF